jgi:hypothetical protein
MSHRQHGRSYLGVLDSDIGSVSLLDTPFTDLSNVVTGNDYFYIEGASATVPMSIAKVSRISHPDFCFVDDVLVPLFFFILELFVYQLWSIIFCFFQVALNEDRTKVVSFSIIWSSSSDVVQYSSFFSAPEFVEFSTSSTGQKAYAYFYPPSNPNFQGLPDEKPPLLVKTHGK